MNKASLAWPLTLIIIGAIWLLKTTSILPATITLIALGLTVAGIVTLVVDGINKQSVVSGPMLMYAGAAIYAKEQYGLSYSPLLALGLIVLGSLMLLARSNLISHKHSKNTTTR